MSVPEMNFTAKNVYQREYEFTIQTPENQYNPDTVVWEFFEETLVGGKVIRTLLFKDTGKEVNVSFTRNGVYFVRLSAMRAGFDSGMIPATAIINVQWEDSYDDDEPTPDEPGEVDRPVGDALPTIELIVRWLMKQDDAGFLTPFVFGLVLGALMTWMWMSGVLV